MTKKQWQILVGVATATICGGLSQIASAPPELQAQLPQMFPDHYRGWIGLGLKIIMGIAAGYATWASHNPAIAKELESGQLPTVLSMTRSDPVTLSSDALHETPDRPRVGQVVDPHDTANAVMRAGIGISPTKPL